MGDVCMDQQLRDLEEAVVSAISVAVSPCVLYEDGLVLSSSRRVTAVQSPSRGAERSELSRVEAALAAAAAMRAL